MSNDPKNTAVDWSKLIKNQPTNPQQTSSNPTSSPTMITKITEGFNTPKMIGHETCSRDDNKKKDKPE